MKISIHVLVLPLALGSLSLLSGGCSSKSTSVGLRSCYDTGSNVVCVTSSALSTASADVNGDGTPDVFVCADDDGDSHDRKRDRDQSGSTTANGAADEDGDGVADDLDCGHRTECGVLTNAEEESGDSQKTGRSLSAASDGSGDGAGNSGDSHGSAGASGDNGGGAGSSGGDQGTGGTSGDNHGSGGASGDSHGGGTGASSGGGDNSGSGGTSGGDHGGGAGSDGSGDNHGSGGQGSGQDDGKDEHPQTGCQPPPLTPAPGV